MVHGRTANPPSKRIHAFALLFPREALRSSFTLRIEGLNLSGCLRPRENTVFSPLRTSQLRTSDNSEGPVIRGAPTTQAVRPQDALHRDF